MTSPLHAIVSVLEDRYVQVEPPRPDDPKDIAAFKLFLLAAIGRRQNDEAWDKELADWFFAGGAAEITEMNINRRPN